MGEFKRKLDDYSRNRNWQAHRCPYCANEYYSKKDTKCCGSYHCQKGYTFLTLPKKKGVVCLDELLNQTEAFFRDHGHKPVIGKTVINNIGDTLFIVAGIQSIFPGLYKDSISKEDIPAGSCFIAQPSVRIKFLKEVGKIDGISTSFVNICTEEAYCSVDRYIHHLDTWLNYLSHIGLFVGDMTLVKKGIALEGGGLRIRKVLINYGGLELGDAAYIEAPLKSQGDIAICDTGFGLERVCWALNKSESYFDAIGPWSVAFQREFRLIDFLRTMTVMAGSGIEPSHKAQGYRLRKLAKNCVSLGLDISIDELVSHYYRFWSTIIPLVKSLDDCKKLLQEEVNRNHNMAICKQLDLKPDPKFVNQNLDLFIWSLTRKGVSLNSIRKLFEDTR